MTKVFIVVLNWNRANDTLECLRSVAKLKAKDCVITTVIVDNGSQDNSLKEIKEYTQGKKDYEFVLNKANLGYAEGNNTGMRFSLAKGADYIMVLNNDALVDKYLVQEFLKIMTSDSNIGALTPKIYFAPGFEFHKDKYDKRVLGRVIWSAGGKIDWQNVYGKTRGVDEVDSGRYDKVSQTDYATGTCAFYKSEVLKKVGVFDKNYFLYYEDTDLSQRIRLAGYKILYVPEAVVWHKVAQSSGIGSDLNDYYITRNRMLFGMKYAPLRAKLALLKESIKFLFAGRKWQRLGLIDFYRGNFGRGSYR